MRMKRYGDAPIRHIMIPSGHCHHLCYRILSFETKNEPQIRPLHLIPRELGFQMGRCLSRMTCGPCKPEQDILWCTSDPASYNLWGRQGRFQIKFVQKWGIPHFMLLTIWGQWSPQPTIWFFLGGGGSFCFQEKPCWTSSWLARSWSSRSLLAAYPLALTGLPRASITICWKAWLDSPTIQNIQRVDWTIKTSKKSYQQNPSPY